MHTDDEASESDASRGAGEQEPADDEQAVAHPKAQPFARSEGAHETRDGDENERHAHDRPSTEPIREQPEDQRADHVADEEDDLHEASQRDAIAHHRPLENSRVSIAERGRGRRTSSTSVDW